MVSYSYDAWGKMLSKTGTLASTLGTIQPFRYRAYAFDEETGLYYLRSRFYNSEWARFTCADTVFERNLFAYCSNNPNTFSDEDGQSPFSDFMQEMTLLHDAVAMRVAKYVNGRVERTFTRIIGAGRGGGYGFPDVRKGQLVWEIKPLTAYGKLTGPRQMSKYTTQTGFHRGYAVHIPCFPWTLNGKKGLVYIINGCAATNDAGVVYYKFVPFKEKKPAQEPAPVTVPAPSFSYASSHSRSDTAGLKTVFGMCIFALALLTPIPGDEALVLLFAIP